MRGITRSALCMLAVGMTAACSDPDTTPTSYGATAQLRGPAAEASLAGGQGGFGFNGTVGERVFLTGGGSFDVASASNTLGAETRVGSGGGFRCIDAVAAGPLAGCGVGEGVRWDAEQLLVSTNFRCSGADVLRFAATGTGTAVFLAGFYRAGDGDEESFTAPMIVSETDIAADIPGEQNLWIQGVGCGAAVVHFSK